MRSLSGLLLLPILIVPALAEEPPKPAQHVPRVTMEQHFTQANLAHDGHLTQDEAKGGYPAVAKHFDEIDVDHKGYLTANDIRAWQVMRRAAHRRTQPLSKPTAQPVRWDRPVAGGASADRGAMPGSGTVDPASNAGNR